MAAQGYNLEQTGQEVQGALNKIIAIAPATQESPGLMSAEDKAKLDGITPENFATKDELSSKVDKETGKGLSSNDFTNANKEAVEQSMPLAIQLLLDRTQDMNTIRSGAAAGATAYQKPSTGIPASDLASGVIPTALSELSEDATHRTVTDSEKVLWNETNIIHASVMMLPSPFTGYTPEQMLAAFGITQDDYIRLANRGGVYSTLLSGSTFVVLGASSGSMFGPVFITGVSGTEIKYRKVEFQNTLNTYSFSSEIVIKGFSGNYNDLANKPDLSPFITKSVDDLANYYLKSETFTKTEVQNLIGAIQQFHYEIYASRSEVTSPASNVLYLIGPTGTGADKYEEYVYDATKQDPWVKIGDTTIDLSGYVTTQALNEALANYTTTADLTNLLAGKQDAMSALTNNEIDTIWSNA